MYIIIFSVNLDLSVDRYSLMYGLVGAILQAAAFVLFEEHLQNYNVSFFNVRWQIMCKRLTEIDNTLCSLFFAMTRLFSP